MSAAILDRMRDYRATLEDYSKRLLPVVDWRPTEHGNVTVRNDTADFYRFFDATPHAEFLYGCVQHTIEYDLPEEARYLERYDVFSKAESSLIVDMPERLSNLLFRFLRQNGGQTVPPRPDARIRPADGRRGRAGRSALPGGASAKANAAA